MTYTSVSEPPNSSDKILEPENMNSTAATDLPPEIWSIIFANLSLMDRNSVRLTCPYFYMACDSPRAPEKIVCNSSNTDALVQTWSRADRKLRTLTLNGAQLLDDFILEIFKKHGPYIQSLTLRKCTLAPGLLKQIIEHCKSLRSMSLIRIPTQKELFDDFLALEYDKVLCENVIDFTFSLKNGANSLSNREFLRVFATFPNIRKLKIKILVDAHFNELTSLSGDATSAAIFSFSCIYDQLTRWRSQLEALKLYLTYDLGDAYLSFQTFNRISQIQMPRLRNLSLNWIDLWDPSPNTFSPFKTLTRFHCVLGPEILHSHSPSTFVQLLLSSAPGLHTLKLDLMDDIFAFLMEKDCFVALVRSQVRNFNLHVLRVPKMFLGLWLTFELSSLNVSLEPNNVLKCLMAILDQKDFSLFTTYFHSLECVIVGETTESSLSNIVNFQSQLKSLSIYNCEMYPIDGAAGNHSYLQQWLHKENPSRIFANLTRLDILACNHPDLAAFLIFEFKFPKLKSLTIKTLPSLWSGRGSEVDLVLRSTHALRELEYLNIGSSFMLPIPDALAMCRSLPKLRYFVVSNEEGEFLDDLKYAEFFNNCPSLHIFVHENSDQQIKYIRDISTNNILNVSSSDRASMYKIPKEYYKYRF